MVNTIDNLLWCELTHSGSSEEVCYPLGMSRLTLSNHRGTYVDEVVDDNTTDICHWVFSKFSDSYHSIVLAGSIYFKLELANDTEVSVTSMVINQAALDNLIMDIDDAIATLTGSVRYTYSCNHRPLVMFGEL